MYINLLAAKINFSQSEAFCPEGARATSCNNSG